MWIVNVNYIFLKRIFKEYSKGVSKVFPHSKGFQSASKIRKCFKYSEKQIGISHGNLYNPHFLSNSSPAKLKRGFLYETGFSLPH